jgi:hypothetical protein
MLLIVFLNAYKREEKMEQKALRKILEESREGSKEYERIEGEDGMSAEEKVFKQLQVCCRTLEEIEDIAREELDMRAKEEDV